ncbi:hypothetical protein [Mesorhizobium sp. M6A.T.Cr.TU.016.01.1.1]|uniref:hypothetical protein n=1 Tax=Mesorhizobium sp. M6A.T.Cr.TU.016.01.1.1 TaxID=2493677 RepID=UPI000F7583C4|nr:hypothetical protein [Mesorhizobium sp. M6A.T.Cr.TU.016.01.1.1]AZO67659.1 hypothetical protein EJ075_23885 [Mesorhizobium sp. M6A.T.Cr.TU.016.01.1.1]
MFESEAALCAAFIAQLPKDWTAYPETAGFDILLVRGADGAQIGVEAKMTLNAKVLLQAVEGIYSGRGSEYPAPDFRAALVPSGAAGAELKTVASYLGVVVIAMTSEAEREAEEKAFAEKFGVSYRRAHVNDKPWFTPELPVIGHDWRRLWADHCPAERCKVPAYVPDVVAGASGPSQLSEWKIKAIKICIILERRGFVTIGDFKRVGIDRKRWFDMRWLAHTDDRGRYIAGRSALNLRAAHPVNYGQIEGDFEKWKPAEDELKAELKPRPALL